MVGLAMLGPVVTGYTVVRVYGGTKPLTSLPGQKTVRAGVGWVCVPCR